MTTRSGERPSGARLPAPELIAVVTAIVLYGSVAFLGMPTGATERAVSPDASSDAGPTPSPGSTEPSPHPRRADVAAILEIDARLLAEREILLDLLARSTVRSSEVAVVLRRISGSIALVIDRATRLSLDPDFQSVGAQLEILYADTDATVDRALDAALTSDTAYREAAEKIVDLFVDLPGIDASLESILTPATASSSPSPSPSGAATSDAPTAPPASGSGLPSASPGLVASPDDPTERLQDRSFEEGVTRWQVVTTPGDLLSTASDAPLVGTGARSIRLEITASDPAASIVVISQSAIDIAAGREYEARLVVAASTLRQLRLRVVGTHQETHGLVMAEIGPEASVASLRFTALIDDPSATFLIELPGAWTGNVWLDDASIVERP
jgi:hypothetical protein